LIFGGYTTPEGKALGTSGQQAIFRPRTGLNTVAVKRKTPVSAGKIIPVTLNETIP
jgi:hypothetical protein